MTNRADIQREKLLNAIIFFTKNTRWCHKVKLLKLLHFLDFQIYRETGKSTTGLEYFAWPMGPVPRTLFEELDAPRPDMKAALRFTGGTGDALRITALRPFDEGPFTRRELNVMAKLAEMFREATADQIRDSSHERSDAYGRPWHQVFKVENHPQCLIPYSLALKEPGSITTEQAEEIEEEDREAAALFK